MPIAYLDTVDSPAGPLAFAVDDAGALVRTQFVHGAYARSIEQELERAGYQEGHADEQRTTLWREQLLEYSHGARQTFILPLALGGTEWQRRVWLALTAIPFGQTLSYGELAARLGRPHAARAVGHANGANPLSLVVPCHRLIGANGALTGYGGGLDLKARLLAHETRVIREQTAESAAS
ncbi:MAG TPA: methylated-DNA--[protein]-cysteine S-methyltransferase [Ktedonobacterales bacterium]|jgi:methylated-DNA-[protein]-cysteine S-methyltransferase|nr:methylated-DNA--[protein]-cysteine S-methyltransferase [Ktedonobacterales bacterium]